ncbi:MAG TPA: amidase family protein [Gemmatimonadaceae bacterium]|nr:amidase family protein [Gemmatimonadaceae bacterium]
MRAILLCALLSASPILPIAAQRPAPFQVEEATIADIHAAMGDRRLTCRALVDQYLRRIETYDKRGPAINAIVVVSDRARAEADSLDRRFEREGLIGPMHCIPMIVKDNFETMGMPNTAGSLSLIGFSSGRDAFQVRRLREAGAIVLAKSNMAEFAWSPYETVSSILPGYTRNPYDLDRVTAGSSGGTAAAVAACFGAVGLGTDTGNSIRGPSAHQALVGIRSTMGLTSRAGIVPLMLGSDVAGPMARTVADAAAVLQVIAGPDPDDPVTAASADRVPADYAASLERNGLRGARIGVLRQAYERPTTDPEVVRVFEAALGDMREQGATVIDTVMIDDLQAILRISQGGCNTFRYDLERYLASHGAAAPVRTLEEIVRGGRFHPSVYQRLEQSLRVALPPEENPGCRSRDAMRERLREAVIALMDAHRLDALVYPTWSNPPRLIGDLNTPHGDNNQLFAPSTGFPAITVPMGWLLGGALPAGIQFFGRPWSEPTLIRLAYAYEQATRHRRAPGMLRQAGQ